MKHLSRHEALSGAGVAALAAGAAVVPFAGARAVAPSDRALIREFAARLLSDQACTVSEWIERKQCAVALQALIGDEPEPWTELELVWVRP